jgi:hypothetical protein
MVWKKRERSRNGEGGGGIYRAGWELADAMRHLLTAKLLDGRS